MTDPIHYPIPPDQTQTPPLPAGIWSINAWQSIPKFIRFAIWFYAVASMVGFAIWVLFGLAIVAA